MELWGVSSTTASDKPSSEPVTAHEINKVIQQILDAYTEYPHKLISDNIWFGRHSENSSKIFTIFACIPDEAFIVTYSPDGTCTNQKVEKCRYNEIVWMTPKDVGENIDVLFPNSIIAAITAAYELETYFPGAKRIIMYKKLQRLVPYNSQHIIMWI